VAADPLYRRVLIPAAGLVLIIVALAIAFPSTADRVVGALQDNVVGLFSWYYVLIVAAFVGFSLWMGLGRYGDIRLGRDDETPEFSRKAWFSMLFAAGMGIGLVFWGVAEPLSHYSDPKPGISGTPSQLAQFGLAQTYVHWGIHAWAIYAVVGLGLGYAIHRKGHPVSIRWALEPLLGERVKGRLGDAIDIAAVVGGTFGVATTLGLGVLQIGAGAERIGLADSTVFIQIVIIVVISIVAGISVVSGLARGLKWLSNFNMGLAGGLLIFILIVGPTLFLLRTFVQSIGNYLTGFLALTFNVSAFTGEEGQAWQASWSTFFWGSWISWAPLVGIFIARISRGRTIREFVAGVLMVPALVSFMWFAIFGGTAIYRELFGAGGLVPVGGVIPEFALFDLLDALPWSQLVSIVTIVLIATFLITSVNSGSFTLAMLSHGGDPDPPAWNRLLWVIVGAAAGAALLVTGGLVPLQTAVIVMAVPFSVIMVLIAVATAQAFYREHEEVLHAQGLAARRELAEQIRQAVRAEREKEQVVLEPDRSKLPDVPIAWPGKMPFGRN
jgi:choline/glycine/proline betaine transport protein